MTSTPFAASTSSAVAHAGVGERVRVDPEKERTVDRLRDAITTDRLGDREYVPLVERFVER